MNSTLTLPVMGLILLCILSEAAREVCLKIAADHTAFHRAVLKPITWVGVFFWATELVGWTTVLQHIPLSVGFPLMALSNITIVAAGAIVLKEKINLRHAVGALLITAGVACVGASNV